MLITPQELNRSIDLICELRVSNKNKATLIKQMLMLFLAGKGLK